ncbi:MAG: chemotaxis response regulator protein-glutamate methylesterase [Myxococcales bacterium FL481]|nr:MAG: chemotaxis response regulator protein-glutamate methylesterase [Myxococcales bacterium FL481]
MIRVLVIDDSAVVREVLTRELNKHEDIEVVGTAPDPIVARDRVLKLKPDVLTLDIEMPRMDGLTFLDKLMRHIPIPTVVVSSLTKSGDPLSMKALSVGAVAVVPKPGGGLSTPDVGRELVHAIRAASLVSRDKLRRRVGAVAPQPAPLRSLLQGVSISNQLVAITSSTGGPPALETILSSIPAAGPPMVIAQHMAKGFLPALAKHLHSISAMTVRLATDREPVSAGVALVAPDDHHMTIVRDGARFTVRLNQGPRVHFQRPAGDPLLGSVAREATVNAVGIVLTGMGRDGAQGLLEMRKAGAHTIAQDEASSVVFGMPGAAVAAGAAEQVLPIDAIAGAILSSRVFHRGIGTLEQKSTGT